MGSVTPPPQIGRPPLVARIRVIAVLLALVGIVVGFLGTHLFFVAIGIPLGVVAMCPQGPEWFIEAFGITWFIGRFLGAAFLAIVFYRRYMRRASAVAA
jgi:membrane protein implicated in regulation of membrane protease activity